MIFDVLHAIDKLVPGAKLIIRGEQIYENVEWFDERPMPTKEQVEAKLAQLPDEFSAAQQAAETHKANAVAKLKAIGLTDDEIAALGVK